MHSNNFDTLTPEIGSLSNLEYIDISNNYLKSIPPEFGNCLSLKEAYLGYNELTTLPSEIGKLSKLELLAVGYNYLSRLPDSIVHLQSIQEVSVAYNCLSAEHLSDTVIAFLDTYDPDWKESQDTITHITYTYKNSNADNSVISLNGCCNLLKMFVPNSGFVTVSIFNSNGRLVKKLLNGYRRTGNYSLSLSNTPLSSGVYFLNVIAGTHSLTTRIVLTK